MSRLKDLLMTFKTLTINLLVWIAASMNLSLAKADHLRGRINELLLKTEAAGYTNLDSVQYYADSAMLLARANGYPLLALRAELIKVDAISEKQPIEAQEQYLQMLKKIRAEGLVIQEELLLKQLTNFYLRWEQYTQAADYAHRYLALHERLHAKDPKSCPDSKSPYGIMAGIYARQGNYDKAISMYNAILQQALSDPHDRYFAAGSISEKGNAFFRSANYDSARATYMLGVNIAREVGDEGSLGYLTDNVGLTWFARQQYDSALRWQMQAMHYRQKTGNLAGMSVSAINLTQTYLKLSNLPKAIAYADSARSYAQELNTVSALEGAAYISGLAYQAIGEHMAAAQHFHRAYQMQDSLRAINDMQAVKSAAIQIEMERQRLNNLDLKNRNSNLILFGGILTILIIMISAAGLFLIKQHFAKKRLIQQLRITNHTKDKLFSIIGHDLRSPISSLRSMLDLLIDKMISREEFLTYSQQLNRDLSNAYILLENLLIWAKSQQNGLVVRQTKVNLHTVVTQELKTALRRAADKQIRIFHQMPDQLKVQFDPDHLALIIRNLISNAIKFTPSGGEVKLTAVSAADRVTLTISDTGQGISPKDLQNLFRPEPNTSRLGTEGEKGTGLGLLLIKEMTDHNNANIEVKSELGKGSDFILTMKKVR